MKMITKPLLAILLLLPLSTLAQTQVPNVFEDGTPVSAVEVNENFDALEAAIDAIPEGPAGPQGEQGPKGEPGPAGADGVSDGLTCSSTNQIIVWDGVLLGCVLICDGSLTLGGM